MGPSFECHEEDRGRDGAHRVLLVEDDLATRARLALALAGDPGISLVADVGTVALANAVLDAEPVDTLLTDLELPDGNGLELIRRLTGSAVTRCLVVTVFGDEHHVVQAIVAGASGYLLKDGSAEDVVQAVRDVESGGSPISPSIARYLLKHFNPGVASVAESDPDGPRLTDREREILKLVAKGFAYAEIATLLGLSTHTVSTHVKNTYRKLSVNSRGEAVYEAIQLGLISVER